MKQIKFVILGAAVLGLLSCFLPYISEGPISMSLWDFRKFPSGNEGLLNGPKQVYIAFACFLVPAIIAGLAIKGKLSRGMAIAPAVFFLAAFSLKFVRKGISSVEGTSTAIGGKLIFVAALVGLVASIVAIVKPEDA